VDVTLPDGTVIEGVPDGTTKEQLLGKLMKVGHPAAAGLAGEMGRKSTLGEMSFGQRFAAGGGSALANIGTGAKQLVGAGPSREDLRNEREAQRDLLRTPAGFAGNLATNITTLAPLSVIPGANTVAGAGAIGMTAGALQPAETTLEKLGQMGLGGALGSGTQFVAQHPLQTWEAMKSVAGAPLRGAKALVEPFYQSGREQILARALREVTGQNSPQVLRNLQQPGELVPGSVPTAGEMGGSPGLAAMQRSAAAVNPEAYTTRGMQQNEARVNALLDLAGTGGQREFYDASRKTAAQQLYDQAYKQGVDMSKMTPGTKGEITKLLQRPAIQDAITQAKVLARNEGVRIGDPAGSVKGLDYIKRALDDQINTTSGNEQRILVSLKDRLLTTIDKLSPEYTAARTTFQEMSKPINQMDIAQRIADKSIRPLDSVMQPNAYARALSDDTAAAATGFNKATLENTMSLDQLARLKSIKQDLARSVALRDLGRGPGSDTTQKLAMTNLMQRAGIPQGVLNFPVLGRAGNWVYEVADQRMKDQLAQSLLNPRETARLMQLAPARQALIEPSQAARDRAALILRSIAYPSIPYTVGSQ
jgi:hypothetical protein